MYKKKALITGIHGQDGSYLTELLIEKGYEVIGISRKEDIENNNIDFLNNIPIFTVNVLDIEELEKFLQLQKPDLIFNFASISSVALSWKDPLQVMNLNGIAVLNFLEIIRLHIPNTKFLQASSGEIFSGSIEFPQNEKTAINPTSPYGVSKAISHHLIDIYRKYHSLFVVNAILYNHESPRRPTNFVTRKITRGVAAIKLGIESSISLGNINITRDWGHAKDYVKAMYLMLNSEKPKNYVICMGVEYSLKNLIEKSFQFVGIDNWKEYVKVDPQYFRPFDKNHMIGNSNKIRNELGWIPEYTFDTLVKEMVDNDIKLLRKK